MTKVLLLLAFFPAAPVIAQVPVYSNATLGTPPAMRHVLTPEEYRSLLAHQFVYVPPGPSWRERPGPRVGVSTWTMPTAAALRQTPSYAQPWSMWSYTGRHPFIPVYGVTVNGVTVSTPTAVGLIYGDNLQNLMPTFAP